MTWSDAPGSDEDAMVVSDINDASNGVLLLDSDINTADLMWVLPQIYSSGRWQYSWKMYVF